jgi:dephospho-CoA kinase
MIILGLTGSIGMGKSTTAAMFRASGVPVQDADATVHALYAGAAAPLVEAAFPGVLKDGAVDRILLSAHVVGKPEAMRRLEAIVHPLVSKAERAFLRHFQQKSVPLVVLDVPLLFETNGSARADMIAVVSAPPAVQRDRVMARPGMTEERFKTLLSRQLPDGEKRRRAHFIIETGCGLEAARHQVQDIIRALAAVSLPNRMDGEP